LLRRIRPKALVAPGTDLCFSVSYLRRLSRHLLNVTGVRFEQIAQPVLHFARNIRLPVGDIRMEVRPLSLFDFEKSKFRALMTALD